MRSIDAFSLHFFSRLDLVAKFLCGTYYINGNSQHRYEVTAYKQHVIVFGREVLEKGGEVVQEEKDVQWQP